MATRIMSLEGRTHFVLLNCWYASDSGKMAGESERHKTTDRGLEPLVLG
jgi:hypothetical protein